MNKITFSLNYRKPKDEYMPDEELLICVRYYHKVTNSPAKIIKKSTGVKCKLKDWDTNWHKKECRSPVKNSDLDSKAKNLLIQQSAKNFEDYLIKIQTTPEIKYSPKLISSEPKGILKDKWTNHKNNINLVNPANKRLIDIIVVGTGLAGGSAAATLAELGYNVKAFCFQDSPRRAHSIAAQGGINAAKNYQGDGDSTYRLFYDTVKGGDYRSRESNVYRLAEVSTNIIDQCVAQGVPFARDYGGLLDNRSFGGVLVSRTFYAKGQTGQQLLLGAYSAMNRQISRGKIKMYNRHEMLDIVLVDGKARGIITRNLITGAVERHSAHAVVLGSGGYGNVFYLSTNAMGSNVTAAWKAHKRGAYFANPCFTQIHPTCIPVSGEHQSKLTLMSESLRNDGRIWVPKIKKDVISIREGKISPVDISEKNRDYFLERRYPAFGNLVPRDVASRAAKERCDAGFGVNSTGEAVYLDFAAAIIRYGKEQAHINGEDENNDDLVNNLGTEIIKKKYGNLFQMYEKIVDQNPYKTPMMIYPAVHYTMGGIWVDYNLMTTIPGLYAIGEANFSDHGANRLGASALMQGLADGYFVLPYTIGDYLSDDISTGQISTDTIEFQNAEEEAIKKLDFFINNNGKHSVDYFHKKLGKIMWNKCGMARNSKDLNEAIKEISELRNLFWNEVKVPGSKDEFNEELAKAGRVADFLELGELFAKDALTREESCGGHFRDEHQTPEGEAMRDKNYQFVSAWEYTGEPKDAILHKEELNYNDIEVKERSYK
ncbi:fumarate reductase/succinate dehydrogenase flavoprotein subunit [Flavobacteriaceae bacterium]|nr:fumarate reductase/succinate dehydrogenase flavoprotein subunit [Flavobacteriaceae bacterium]MDC1492340.1 fumarate reductase/succinate dehydrogenase flavoprotein subunit [Flavobacteriaceae bacterium]